MTVVSVSCSYFFAAGRLPCRQHTQRRSDTRRVRCVIDIVVVQALQAMAWLSAEGLTGHPNGDAFLVRQLPATASCLHTPAEDFLCALHALLIHLCM